LSHNVDSRYAGKSIKGSKDSGDCLGSKQSISKEMSRWVGAQAQVNLAKKTQNTPSCDVTHREPQTQIKEIVFQSKLEDYTNP